MGGIEMKSSLYIKILLIFVALYFLGHIAVAVAQTTIVTLPDGGQRVCIIQNGYVVCY
jgi:hypothetical protein